MTTSWADLDKLAVAKPRPDGSAVLIARDERGADEIAEARHLSTIVAICRVLRGRFALAERHGGRGVMIYATRGAAPSFLVDAVSAAGGVLFDGTREHTNRSPLATTVQLDAAFCDLAMLVRRRLKVRSLADALDVLQHEVRRRAPTPADPTAWWTAIIELTAVAGEVVRAERPGRWVEAANERLPAALELDKANRLMPAKLAQTIVEGGDADMRTLVELVRPVAPKPKQPVFARVRPLLCDRRKVPIDRLTWELLVADEVDTDDMPVIVYVDDRDATIEWPQDHGRPNAALRARALANLAKHEFQLEALPRGIVLVTGGYYGAEALLDRATMERVAEAIGSPGSLLVGVPARGYLFATDAALATLDDDLQHTFLLMVEREYLHATERDRISSEAILYLRGTGPVGRLQSNFMDTRRALRRIGVDPDV